VAAGGKLSGGRIGEARTQTRGFISAGWSDRYSRTSIGFDYPEMSHLGLEPPDTVQRRVQFFVVRDHGASGAISMMPLRLPSRFTCQYSIIAASLSEAAKRRTQNTLAPNQA
jgi:hypothetical protein